MKRQLFLQALAESWRIDPELSQSKGRTIVACEDRRDTNIASGYAFGEHLVVLCDPIHAEALELILPDTACTVEQWRAAAQRRELELVGSARLLLIDDQRLDCAPDTTPALSSGYEFASLDAAAPENRSELERLVESLGPEAADDAEIELDDPDHHAVVVRFGGEPIAYAGAKPWGDMVGWGDIGIAVCAEHRRAGVGAAAVRTLVGELRDSRIEPLYRHNDDNTASAALADSVGFAAVSHLSAYRF
ncbi:MAG: GNAT family N-acetyltransferase [Acidimicrobiales bacterium]|nr:GNAT family N-acetyltransferase [Acidimicrobiales bacterium]